MAKTLEDYRQESLAKMKRQKSMDAASGRLAARDTTGTSLAGRGTTLTPNLMRRTKENPIPKPSAVDRLKASRTSKEKLPPEPVPKTALARIKERNKGRASVLGTPAPKPAPSKTAAKPAPSKPAAKPAASAGAVKTVSTKGGNYPVYKKGSAEAKSFGAAFNEARKAGLKTFPWGGRSYSTKKKGE